MLGQVEGRTADDAGVLAGPGPARLAGRGRGGRHRHVHGFPVRRPPRPPAGARSPSTCSTSSSSPSRQSATSGAALPGRSTAGGKEGDPEYGLKGLLNRNMESLSAAQFGKVIETLDADGHGQQIAIAWIAKEKLRAALNLRARFRRSQPVRTAGKGPALRLLRLVRPERGHPRAPHARHDDLPLAGADRHRRPYRRHQRHLREPQPHRQARGPPSPTASATRQPAPPRPHRCTRGTRRRSPQQPAPLRTTTEEMQARGVNILEPPDFTTKACFSRPGRTERLQVTQP